MFVMRILPSVPDDESLLMSLNHWLRNLICRLNDRAPRRRIHSLRRAQVSIVTEPLEARRLMSVTPVGFETQVNTTTQYSQLNSAVAMDAAGDSVVVWQSFGQDGNGYGVYGQRYAANGTKKGAEFRVNTETSSTQSNPTVAMDAAGDFVVTWNSLFEDGSSMGIYAQRYTEAGATVGSEFRVNTTTTNSQDRPVIAMDTAGDFVITWQSFNQDALGFGVYAQRYAAGGAKIGTEFQVNSFTTGYQQLPSVAMDGSGNFVIVWQSEKQDGSDYGIYAKRFSAAGAVGPEFRVNTFTTNDQNNPVVAMNAAGDFVVAWQSTGQDGNQDGIFAQRISAAGIALGSEFQVNTITQNGQTYPAIAIDGAGDFVVAWETYPDGGAYGVDAQRFTSTGVKDGAQFLVNTYTTNTQQSVAVAMDAVGDFVMTWDSGEQDGDNWGVYTQRFTPGPPVLSGVSGTTTYAENDPHLAIGPNLIAIEPHATNIVSATVTFSNWQAEDRVDFNNIYALQHSFSQNLAAHTAALTITGSDTADHYQALLSSVQYWDVSDSPVTTNRIATFKMNDGTTDSNTVSRNIAVIAVNDAPLLSAIESTPLAYKANDPAFPPQPISATLLVNEPDSSKLSKATVQITSGYQNSAFGHDVLSFVNKLGITGSFDSSTGKLTLSGSSSVSNYRTALRSVTYSSSGALVSTAMRKLTIHATDDFTPTPATSLAITRDVTVSTTNVPPAISGIPASALSYIRGSAATTIAPGLFVLDPDSINMSSATIKISNNYQNGQDVLAFTSGFGVTGSFSAATGTLSLNGITSLANYQTLLRSVTYKTNTATASKSTRTISFILNDGVDFSGTSTRDVILN